MPRPSDSFSRRVLMSQLAVIIVVLSLAAATFAWLGARTVTDTTETQALSIARTLAAEPQVRSGATRVTAEKQVGPDVIRSSNLQALAMDIRSRNHVDFVVVTDNRGLRLAHPDPSLLGKKVSTSPDVALSGKEEITHDEGTLGETVRAKVPIYSATDDGTVVGEVSVGVRTSAVGAEVRRKLWVIGALAAVALAVGIVASLALGRRLKRQTLGIGPEELAEMARHQEAVLRGLDDGVLGFSPDGRLTLSNETARSLLGYSEYPTEEVRIPHEIQVMVGEVLGERDSGSSELRRRISVGDRILLATAVQVRRGDISVGGVVTLRDETQILTMSRQLESVITMADALRAQRHEFANRLHTVMGLVTTGAHHEAESYLAEILRTGPIGAPVKGIEHVDDPYLRALAEAKSTTSSEVGVELRISEDSLVFGRVREPEDVTLILGNLIDNAVRAAVQGETPSKAVEVQLLSDGEALHAVVTDTGAGIDSPEDGERAFQEGVSGSGALDDDAHGLGIGLALCRRVARRQGGRVWLVEGKDPRMGGASFGVELPHVLEEKMES
ncbi:sensor histidine kinase [Kocuria sp. TGY1127_2]|uniref:ATP-binding protein n=1 Tax=Kocuria sp. TGY1127_2 TaxID=2711328 RepID=UPI0015BB5282|nr:sensor histidine kinase [Kocuria sp. TGY1127_2]